MLNVAILNQNGESKTSVHSPKKNSISSINKKKSRNCKWEVSIIIVFSKCGLVDTKFDFFKSTFVQPKSARTSSVSQSAGMEASTYR